VSELPYMPLWINDYLGDTLLLSAEQHGCYLLLLMHMWNAGGSLPNDVKKLAWICKVSPSRWKTLIAPALDQYFAKEELSDGDVIQNRRLSEELQKSRKNRAQKQGAARVKWLKSKQTRNVAAYASHTSPRVKGYQ
jgi:uncharacterized protein YdaU (DUF1376 family)